MYLCADRFHENHILTYNNNFNGSAFFWKENFANFLFDFPSSFSSVSLLCHQILCDQKEIQNTCSLKANTCGERDVEKNMCYFKKRVRINDTVDIGTHHLNDTHNGTRSLLSFLFTHYLVFTRCYLPPFLSASYSFSRLFRKRIQNLVSIFPHTQRQLEY